MFDVETYQKLTYLRRTPDGFDATGKYPALLFFHGAGSRGTDISVVRGNPFFTATEGYGLPVVTFAPQCFGECWFDLFEQVQDFADYVRKLPYIDPDRVYLMGVSMGGYCAWQLAMSHPEWFAALIPICGGGMRWMAYRLKNVPVLAYHGELDKTVPVVQSVQMVQAVQDAGGEARLVICPGVKHKVWDNAFADRTLFDWMLSKRRKASEEQTAECVMTPGEYN